MADAEHATIELWEVLCRNCPYWTFREASADEDGRDWGVCSSLHWHGPIHVVIDQGVSTAEDFFCAEHPLIVETRRRHREIIDARCAAQNEADGLEG